MRAESRRAASCRSLHFRAGAQPLAPLCVRSRRARLLGPEQHGMPRAQRLAERVHRGHVRRELVGPYTDPRLVVLRPRAVFVAVVAERGLQLAARAPRLGPVASARELVLVHELPERDAPRARGEREDFTLPLARGALVHLADAHAAVSYTHLDAADE